MLECADSPAVRASAVVVFSQVIALIPINPRLKANLFSAVKTAALEADPSAPVRHALRSCAVPIFRHLKGAFATNLVGIVTRLASDSSPWVVCEVPKFLVAYMEVTGQVEATLSIGAKLLDSQDWHVRCGFVLALADIFRSRQVPFGVVFPILERAVKDTEDEVVTAAAEQLPFVARLAGIVPDERGLRRRANIQGIGPGGDDAGEPGRDEHIRPPVASAGLRQLFALTDGSGHQPCFVNPGLHNPDRLWRMRRAVFVAQDEKLSAKIVPQFEASFASRLCGVEIHIPDGDTLLDALHTCEPLRCHGARRRWQGRQAGEDGRTKRREPGPVQ
jgi:hypothetical protein